LIDEGIPKNKIFFVGDIMVDTLLKNKKEALKSNILKDLNLKKGNYALLTFHRANNVDNEQNLKSLSSIFESVQKKIKIVFPIHPRTQKRLKEFKLVEKVNNFKNFISIPPVSYLDMICLIANSKFVLSDSGGIQQETTTLGIPCLTLRENTERPITIEKGSNTLVGRDKDKILKNIIKILDGEYKKFKRPKFWDGQTSKRIIKVLSGEQDGSI
jgi:UDP-N-acetylglucosamine 2-epimerase (non-hydrolysing)